MTEENERRGIYKLIISAWHEVGGEDERVADFASVVWPSGDVAGALGEGKSVAIKKWPINNGYFDHSATQGMI